MREGQKKRNLSIDECKWVVNALLEKSTNEAGSRVLKKGAISAAAGIVGVTEKSIRRIWKKAVDNFNNTGIYSATPQKVGRVGRKPVYENEAFREAVKNVSVTKRGTMRSLANELGVSTNVVFQKKHEGVLLSHSNAIKPHLRDDNKWMRLQYAINRVRERAGHKVFCGSYDEVHIDEKWFEISQVNRRFYLLPDEQKPNCRCRHKGFMTKAMFLAAIARPRFNNDGECIFDGKIGVWPFVKRERERAQRSSVNRPAGTWETKTLTVDKKVYKEFMIEKVIPAI